MTVAGDQGAKPSRDKNMPYAGRLQVRKEQFDERAEWLWKLAWFAGESRLVHFEVWFGVSFQHRMAFCGKVLRYQLHIAVVIRKS